SNSSLTTSACPEYAALSSAVDPSLLLVASILAPFSNSSLTTSACPEYAAE
ncbi:hypothetical protein L211DRAFT_790783, partial [Terfezia boudieri ATCC MYA-4762]